MVKVTKWRKKNEKHSEAVAQASCDSFIISLWEPAIISAIDNNILCDVYDTSWHINNVSSNVSIGSHDHDHVS